MTIWDWLEGFLFRGVYLKIFFLDFELVALFEKCTINSLCACIELIIRSGFAKTVLFTFIKLGDYHFSFSLISWYSV